MARCKACSKKTSVVFTCKFCTFDHCSACRLQEIHKCVGLASLKATKAKLLCETLHNQKTVSSKLVQL